jgi:CRP/FNR family transcriptional regulator
MRPSDECHQIPLVVSGELRVFKISESGRELTLYRIHPGHTCVLTALSILAGVPFTVHAVATKPTAALLLPRRTFNWLYYNQPVWHRYILEVLSTRVSDLLALIDSVIFTGLPARLADTLLTNQESGVVQATHEQLAAEVGSSREVVSRLLKSWEQQGTVSLSRGSITITSRMGLVDLLAM